MKRCEIRNNPGPSSYFGGEFRGYGLYQWNIKFYGFESEYEIESACGWAFGEYLFTRHQFEYLNEIVGRPIQAHIDGRSGGWLVIDEELTKVELKRVDRHIRSCLKVLPKYLETLRNENSEDEK